MFNFVKKINIPFMEAKQNFITNFIQQQDVQFLIPVYQRNYDWKNEHCKQLLSDIKKVGKNEDIATHFIGSIVYVQTGLSTSPVLTIIDGQQRLTTITLLISALVRKSNESGNKKLSDELTRRYLINEFKSDDEKLKLKPIKKDNEALRYALGLSSNEVKSYSRIIENVNFFYENISTEEIEIIKQGIQKLVFIEISLDKAKDDPQNIFQSLNSTGLDLSQADLIRNYILIGLTSKVQTRIYENYWIEIEQNTTEVSSQLIKTSDFIRDYLTFKFSSIPTINKVFEVFKQRYQFNSENELVEILEEIKLFSKFYRYFINPELHKNNLVVDNLKLIKKLQINVSYPFLLQVFNAHNNGKISDDILIEVIELIQSYTWRRFISNLATNALNKVFMDLYKSIDEENFLYSLQVALISKKGYQRFPNNDEVLSNLTNKDMYNIQPKNRTYFLERLENYGHKIQINIENNSNVSIEHIFPQKPTPEWREKLREQFEEMKSRINTAANLTLSAFNSDLSNSFFTHKRDLPIKGYKASPLRIDKYLAEIEDWNVETLNQRQKSIENRFIEIWKYPNISIEELDTTDELNILDIDYESVRGQSMDYFIFFETKYEKPNWQTLLKTVSTIMFEREPYMFLDTELKDRLKVTTEPKTIGRPLQVSQSYFIESNLSASFIVQRVQRILEVCETDDDLIIKLK